MLSFDNKGIYSSFHDEIFVKRYQSTSPIRRFAHHAQYQAVVDLVPAGAHVLDAGCGEGILSVLLAQHGCKVTGVDISTPNIEASKKYAESMGVSDRTTFILGDAEKLPFENKSFDYVVSSHVLEHLPNFDAGVQELARIARIRVVAAIPTCLNFCSLVLLGGDKYWTFSRRTPYAFVYGFLRVLLALLKGEEGVNETYAGHPELIHIHRFPWRGANRLSSHGLRVTQYRASSFPFPYFNCFVRLTRWMTQHLCWMKFFRNFGYGTTYVCEPHAL